MIEFFKSEVKSFFQKSCSGKSLNILRKFLDFFYISFTKLCAKQILGKNTLRYQIWYQIYKIAVIDENKIEIHDLLFPFFFLKI